MPPRPTAARPKRPITRHGHRLFLNSYEDLAFTRCPQCSRPTKLRTFYLVIPVKPLVLYKRCRLCEGCDPLIVKQSELESLMVYAVEQFDPDLVGNEYLPVGTLDPTDGRQVERGASTVDQDLLDRIDIFRAQVEFEPATWRPG